jgi:hypothetical protein
VNESSRHHRAVTTPKPTRTINPLHFEDLEPHRFEDLVRQLAYSFRRWRVLEPLGRSGADDGIDIRGIEIVRPDTEPALDEDDTTYQPAEERAWFIQCKREKSFGPAKVRTVAEAALTGISDPPYGFLLAAPTDLSKKTRETLAAELHRSGVHEVVAWGRSDLEDLLFLPENDHLLFAYFGISILIRRQDQLTKLRNQFARKRQIFRAVGGLDHRGLTPVLLRDPDEPGYPLQDEVDDFDPTHPPWMWTAFQHHSRPDTIALIYRRYHAWITPDRKRYDAVEMCSHLGPKHRDDEHRSSEHEAECDRLRRYYFNEIPSEDRAWLLRIGWIRLDDILLVDDLGDVFNPPPHLLVRRDQKHGFFHRTRTFVRVDGHKQQEVLRADDLRRTRLFPDPIPDVESTSAW